MPRIGNGRVTPVVLIIRDGWGYNPNPPEIVSLQRSAIAMADTPIHDVLAKENPWALLNCSGEAVGLPAGQMGNSEVGHMNIGAGRPVLQDFVRINHSIDDGSFFENAPLRAAMNQVKADGTSLHVIGLCSDGGVHSHEQHLFALLEMAKRNQLDRVHVHCITDGRDTSPTGGTDYVGNVVKKCAQLGVGRVVSVIGRYYAMDRDNRWDRIEKAYEALVHGNGIRRPNAVEAIKEWYSEGTTDEFIPPTLIHGDSPAEVTTLQDGDGVIFFNFRADRARELIKALVNEDFAEFKRTRPPRVNMTCMSEYDATFTLPVAFEPVKLTNILAHVLAEGGLTQYRISETEKYPHVTYFFNGGEETPVEGEDRFLIPSPRVATYDMLPEMSAHGVTLNLMAKILVKSHAFYVVNFANTDMVGHSGLLPAAIEATEAVDRSVGLVLRAIERVGGVALITSDHGNVECMIGDDGKPHTAHTVNPVDITYVGPESKRVELRDGVLADVAPTILELLGLPKPKEMTGETLFK